tara:strand:- start:40 stop:663 length:624 start_codon:yes stop_codon:yes gene_type:complete
MRGKPYQFKDFYGYDHDTTVGTAPTGVTVSSSSVSWNEFNRLGSVSGDGGVPGGITARGFVHSTSNSTPTIGGSGVTQSTQGSGTGSFQAALTSLSNCTTVYLRAYATNSVGTTYSSVATVQTTRRPHTFKYVTGKFGQLGVCSTSDTVTLYAQSDNSTNLVIQQEVDVYTSATCGNSSQPSGPIWYSDGFHKGRWNGSSWSLVSMC